MLMQVYLKRQVRNPAISAASVRALARAVLKDHSVEQDVTLVFTDNRRIQALNARFRNLDKATDVLAFPDEDDEQYLGDVVISLERAVDQAPRFNNTPDSELARLIVHGLLHLLGFDHHTPADGRRMKAAERSALRHYLRNSLLS